MYCSLTNSERNGVALQIILCLLMGTALVSFSLFRKYGAVKPKSEFIKSAAQFGLEASEWTTRCPIF